MHEFGLVEGIIEAVEKWAGDRPVASVRVRIGTRHHAGQGPMEQAFEMVTAGSALEGARLELIQVSVTSTCRGCGQTDLDDETLGMCPACGGRDILHVGGDDLILESIEYRATAPSVI